MKFCLPASYWIAVVDHEKQSPATEIDLLGATCIRFQIQIDGGSGFGNIECKRSFAYLPWPKQPTAGVSSSRDRVCGSNLRWIILAITESNSVIARMI